MVRDSRKYRPILIRHSRIWLTAFFYYLFSYDPCRDLDLDLWECRPLVALEIDHGKRKGFFILPSRMILFLILGMLVVPAFPQNAEDTSEVSDNIADLMKKAEEGDASAQSNLGFMYHSGEGVPQDYREAAKWFRVAAEQGNADAQNNLAVMYDKEQGVPQDYREAAKWYRAAAEQGLSVAQRSLGFMYHEGQGVPQDYKEAAKWYRAAAEQGLSVAQNSLGVMYQGGLGVPQDYKEAAKWFRAAADQGHAFAQLNLGIMYENGLGVPQDYILAHMWFNLAASDRTDEGRETAAKYRDSIAEKMTSEQIAYAQRLARLWKPKSGGQ